MTRDAPQLTEMARRVLASQPFSASLGAELVSIDRGRVELSLLIRPEFLQQHGFVHGGVLSYLADNAVTFAAGSVFGDAVTVEFKINYVRPAIGDRLLARADVVHAGKRQAVCRSQISVVKGGEELLCAIAQGTVVRPASD